MKTHNMAEVFDVLSMEDKAFICNILRTYGGYAQMHPGLLGLVSIEKVTALLPKITATGRRRALEILSAIRGKGFPILSKSKFYLMLNNAKVLQHFGSHPGRGRRLQILPLKRVTVGVKWSLPRKSYVPDTDVLVRPTVALKLVETAKPGKEKNAVWRVNCEPKFWPEVQLWLIDNCR